MFHPGRSDAAAPLQLFVVYILDFVMARDWLHCPNVLVYRQARTIGSPYLRQVLGLDLLPVQRLPK